MCYGGAISDGAGVAAALALGADYAYMGTRFIGTLESAASDDFKQMLIQEKTGPSPSFLPTIYTDKIRYIVLANIRTKLTTTISMNGHYYDTYPQTQTYIFS